MSTTVSLRKYLEAKSTIDCDTLDAEVPTTLGPFADCTSNQAILCGELAHEKHRDLVRRAIDTARSLDSEFPNVKFEELALELAALALQQLVSVNISGFVHLQVNPFNSYNTDKIVENAKRYVSLCEHLASKIDPSRLCIKITSTWEGLSACRILEASGIRTLATTLSSMEQAALAAEAGCLYIAPYVLELKVHIDPSHKDPFPQLDLCHDAQLYFERHGFKTKVLAASLQTVDELMQLAGINHITISPPLLEALAKAEDSETVVAGRSKFKTIGTDQLSEEMKERWKWIVEEDKFRMAFTRRDDGRCEKKQIQAINVFCDMELALEQMIRDFK